MFIKALEYETANPDQDSTGNVANHFDPVTGKETSHDLDEFNGTTSADRHGQVSAGGVNSNIPTLALPFTNGETVHDTTTTEKEAYRNGPSVETGRL
jgi:hypothetical protein